MTSKNPPPTAEPFTAAMTGLSTSPAWKIVNGGSGNAGGAPDSAASLTSMPAQNAVPVPV
jgi:hypothetical protein